MKIRFLRTISVNVENPMYHEVWEQTFNRWTEIRVDNIIPNGSIVNIKTYEGKYLLEVPLDSFEEVKEEKREFVL